MGEWFTGIFAAIGAFFVFGTLWFWVLGAAFFGALTYFTERDSYVSATILAIVVIWITASVNDVSLFANPMLWLQWGAIYLAVGAFWSFLKWFSFLNQEKDELRKIKQRFLNQTEDVDLREDGTFSNADFAKFAKFINDKMYGYRDIQNRSDLIPSVGEHRNELVAWIVWWPFSAFWTILNDPLRRLANFVVDRFRGMYESMASRVFKNEV